MIEISVCSPLCLSTTYNFSFILFLFWPKRPHSNDEEYSRRVKRRTSRSFRIFGFKKNNTREPFSHKESTLFGKEIVHWYQFETYSDSVTTETFKILTKENHMVKGIVSLGLPISRIRR